ncbi:MAG: GNAT family N-acetyltransferase [Lewinellaceae bacterium]|nr:GNAT family N-acetyltransferase [Lewinellaceae bacterium]
MDHKEQYILFCEQVNLPLQMQPWWLDAVCGPANWELCLSFDKEGEIAGILPYYFKSSFGMKRITMPPLTDYMGPWMRFPEEDKLKRVSRYNIETSILSDLVAQLPRTALFYQTYFPSLKNSLPFMWEGYKATPYFTYRIHRPVNQEQVFQDFKYSVRTEIRKATQQVKVEKAGSLDDFYKINQSSFERKGVKPSFDFELLKRLDATLTKKEARHIYLAKDNDSGAVHAGLYLVMDHSTAYILLTGIDPVLKKSGALYLLYWQAIQDAAEWNLNVDFCGSILPGIESSLRSFGGERVPYYCISKTSNKWLAILSILFNKAY